MKKGKDIFSDYPFNNQNVMISYKGPFDRYTLVALSNNIKDILYKDPVASKKVRKIFIELTQNISFYSEETSSLGNTYECGVGSFIFGESGNSYNFTTGNVIKKEDGKILTDRCNTINSLDRENLRQHKREQRKLCNSTKVGANIGLIQAALVSGNKLNTEVKPINNNLSFYSISVIFDKKMLNGRSNP